MKSKKKIEYILLINKILMDYFINKEVFNKFKYYFKFNNLNNIDIVINPKNLRLYNPIIFKLSYDNTPENINKLKCEKTIYNPYQLDWIVNNYIQIRSVNYEVLLELYPYFYDYIVSKIFYEKVVLYKSKYPKLSVLWNMWININPYAERMLIQNYNMINMDLLSLNPNYYKIYTYVISLDEYEYDIDYLNDDLLSANPSILTYNYSNIKLQIKLIKEELMQELHKPIRILKYLEHNDNIEEYLN